MRRSSKADLKFWTEETASLVIAIAAFVIFVVVGLLLYVLKWNARGGF